MLQTLSDVMVDVRHACLAALLIRQALPNNTSLSHTIYSAVYAGGWRGEGGWKHYDVRKFSAFNASFLRQLNKIVDADEISHGWTIVSEESDVLTLTRDGITASSPKNSVLARGKNCSVKVSALKLGSLGFIYRKHNPKSVHFSCRIYLSIKPEQASWVLGYVASTLMVDDVPFEMKVLSNPLAYWRQDAAVIYVSMSEQQLVLEKITEAQKHLASPFRNNNLLLTERAGAGIAVAEQPSDGRSHGQWVTDLLIGATDQISDLDEVAERFWSLVSADGRTRSNPSYYGY